MGCRFRSAALVVVAAAALACPAAGRAAPYVPASDSDVLERLPVSPLDPSTRRLQALRQALAARPDDLDLALRVARDYIAQGHALADPRYYGYAQGALAPWWAAEKPPAPVLVLRATIRQHDHDFTAALDDLSLALRADPTNAQAWLTRAVVLQVRGEYAEARRSCLEVLQLSTPLVAATCLSSIDSLTGDATKSYDLLRNVLAKATNADSAARAWALTTLAEIAARTGQTQTADNHFQQALSLGVSDQYLLGAYADFLLDLGRPGAVRDLLQGWTRVDALLLRLALAEAMLSAPDLGPHVEALRDRFAAARLRGDTVHRREEARFALRLLQQPDVALQLARANWEVQREPWDARLLLETASAMSDTAAARPVADFLARNGTEDVTLARLVAELQTASR